MNFSNCKLTFKDNPPRDIEELRVQLQKAMEQHWKLPTL